MQIIHNLILILHFFSSICQCILKYFVKYVEIFHELSYFAYKILLKVTFCLHHIGVSKQNWSKSEFHHRFTPVYLDMIALPIVIWTLSA